MDPSGYAVCPIIVKHREMDERYVFEIAELASDELPSTVEWFAANYYGGDASAGEKHFADHFEGGATYIGRTGRTIAGFITMRWVNRRHSIPFIHHFEVFDPYKRHGLGNRLMCAVENRVAEVADTLGVSVGLFDAYGPAQRLYVKRGYVPDGQGVYKDGVPVKRGEVCRMDHDLILWLTKDLRGSARQPHPADRVLPAASRLSIPGG